ncbi:MAG: RsmF rRNA methyltransferase first C-terminal domain-containing protein [Lactobacillaceae bacterium]|jgi:16S rRNA C967 or C1407 C5-methylase (RsmB/RsmF family)/NOL1/NOP2/fmu family ribosome biogenesis protein|nr:RsmF rRNA methyltransferase first C-terminal domain-containing protein [Lactobacillaceae bacterium]
MELPIGFEAKYSKLLGDQAEAFLASFDQPIIKAFRINPLKAQQALYDTPFVDKVAWGQWGRVGAVSGHSVDHTTGLIYSQEPSAQLVAEVAHPVPGDKVLDLAAAPGGKSTHLASFLQGAGLLVSNEIFRKRATILSENMERFGVANALVTNHAPADLSPRFAGFFDKIVLDAPCSGEGMFRKDPAAMQYWDVDYPAKCADLQREILTEAVKMLKPGGELTYSTCTFAPEEDEQMIAWLVNEYPWLTIMPINKPAGVDDGRPDWADGNPELAKTARLFPHHLAGEGHFIAKLVSTLTEDDVATKPFKTPNTKVAKDALELWEAFRSVNLPTFQPTQLLSFGDQLYAPPAGIPDLKGISVMRAGVHLGTLKKNRFEPSLALALALHPDQFARVYALTDAEWAKYVHGDTFMVADRTQWSNGWYLLTMNGNGTGFGKLVDGQMKNFYPKGLRFAVRETNIHLEDDLY